MSAIDGSVSSDKRQSAAALFDRAEAFAVSGDFERAIALYREVLKERPDYPSAQRKLASALHSSGAVEEAAAGYRNAIALDPGDARALDELGRLLGHRGDMRAAIEHLRAAIKLDPHLASARGALGDALCRQGLWGEGIAELEAARASDPNSWPLNLRLGTALGASGPERLDAAMDCFRRVIALVPGHAMAHIHLGLAFWKRGDTAPAIALAERATRLDPQLAAAHGALGSMLYSSGRQEEAIASLRAALALAPNDVTACLYLGVCLGRVPGGRLEEEGVKFLRRAIELDPRQIEAHIQLGAILATTATAIRHWPAIRLRLHFFRRTPRCDWARPSPSCRSCATTRPSWSAAARATERSSKPCRAFSKAGAPARKRRPMRQCATPRRSAARNLSFSPIRAATTVRCRRATAPWWPAS
jgi:protein O-GlcNAc transferase